MSLVLKRSQSILRPLYLFRSLKTTSTEHPKPIFDQNEKLLEKVMKERAKDLPVSIKNPYTKEPKKCILCEYNITPDYKNVKLLSQFVSPYTGKAYTRNITGLCRMKQEEVDTAIRRAIKSGFMASYLKEIEFVRDPKLFDPEKPVRNHKY